MHIILVVLHKLLQRITRRNSNRSNLFNNFMITRKISTTRLLGEFREVKFIWLTIEFTETLPFLESIMAPQVLRKGLPKIIGQKLSCTEPSTRKSVGYFTFPHRTSTYLTIPTGEIF